MLTRKIKLYNDFHHTDVTVRAKYVGQVLDNGAQVFELSERQVKKTSRTLCKSSFCTCSNNALGMRGTQIQSMRVEREMDGVRIIIYK